MKKGEALDSASQGSPGSFCGPGGPYPDFAAPKMAR